MASSPVLAAGAVVVVADQVSDAHIAAFDAASGKPKWKTARPNLVGGYATPVLHGSDILTSGPMEMVAYANDEFPMTKEIRIPNSEREVLVATVSIRSLGLRHSFDIRHSGFVIIQSLLNQLLRFYE